MYDIDENVMYDKSHLEIQNLYIEEKMSLISCFELILTFFGKHANEV